MRNSQLGRHFRIHIMTTHDEQPFHIGDHYLYQGFWYYNEFHVEWSKTHLPGTGPQNCDDCAQYGTVHEGTVFVGYCTSCAVDKYHLQRGLGFSADNQQNGDNIPPLLCNVSPPPEDGEPIEAAAAEDEDLSILNCHFEGGYNDY